MISSSKRAHMPHMSQIHRSTDPSKDMDHMGWISLGSLKSWSKVSTHDAKAGWDSNPSAHAEPCRGARAPDQRRDFWQLRHASQHENLVFLNFLVLVVRKTCILWFGVHCFSSDKGGWSSHMLLSACGKAPHFLRWDLRLSLAKGQQWLLQGRGVLRRVGMSKRVRADLWPVMAVALLSFQWWQLIQQIFTWSAFTGNLAIREHPAQFCVSLRACYENCSVPSPASQLLICFATGRHNGDHWIKHNKARNLWFTNCWTSWQSNKQSLEFAQNPY